MQNDNKLHQTATKRLFNKRCNDITKSIGHALQIKQIGIASTKGQTALNSAIQHLMQNNNLPDAIAFGKSFI